ncbi:WD repeat domain-containing protein [Pseudomassariella vexata]|uniref:WD repeat domain-containing protein n=1 Tax=Pseudomassariella vexata TaxID=1141098 RepID=A0A1Y2EH63_9PEZI|nr:WD repeat domain-containing protein [Pseudomassariella vexata]ORY70125.1 WD repeat domain-containing protein [Pseudomassariella vexata]
MDRPEPGLIKWSPNATYDSFLHINLQHRVVQIYEPTGHAQRGKFDFQKLSKHDDFPPLTTYDWSPTIPGLVAVGTSNGVVNLLRVDDNLNHYLELKLRNPRVCQAVAFNTGNLLAVGLERVRNDQCLHIWDVNRICHMDSTTPGFPVDDSTLIEPIHRLEPSVAVSSVKFFEDNNQLLAVAIKNSGIRIYDLRDPHVPAITNQTKCNNNLAIDYADQNYFASSALDQPGVMVWDRRAISRTSSSPVYLDAVDTDDLPWGAALRLDRAIDVQADRDEDKHSLIRSVRYCRDHRGLLAVLSRTGQLKIMDTHKEFTTPDMEYQGSPELLQVRRSYELDHSYDPKKSDRIVSFDWITLDSPVLTPRVVVLRANGAFDILEKPSYTSEHVYKMVPWQPPYRGDEDGSNYHDFMQLEGPQYSEMMGSILIENALSDIPLFGEEKADIETIIEKALQPRSPEHACVEDAEAITAPLPRLFTHGATMADKLRGLRNYSKQHLKVSKSKAGYGQHHPSRKEIAPKTEGVAAGKAVTRSNRHSHEKLLSLSLDTKGFPKEAQLVLDHVALLRAKDKYLFDFAANRDIVSDDPWLRDMWDWIAGAAQDAADEGMVALGLDLSYMGVHAIWANDLGRQAASRLGEGIVPPDAATFESCIETINQRSGLPRWDGAMTAWPAHRRACSRIALWGRSSQTDFNDYVKTPASERNSSWYTMTTAHALFMGDTKQAVQTLKAASTEYPELLFVSLALQLIGRGDVDAHQAKEQLDFDSAVASKTDPYLRAISSLIATNDWESIANQESLPLRERTFIAFRYFNDERLTAWLDRQVAKAIHTGDIEGIVLTGITDNLIDIFAKYVEKFHDVQTATLVLSICAPRYIDDYRCLAWRNAYRAYLQRYKAFYQRTKFEVESTKKSKRGDLPTVKPPSRQIALRCIYCDAEYELSKTGSGPPSAGERRNPLMTTSINAGVSCPTCGRHLPRCVICLEVVGIPRSDRPESATDLEKKVAARFPTFCLKCEHVLHLDHARQWFTRHVECPVPECRCRCNFRANPELNYH